MENLDFNIVQQNLDLFRVLVCDINLGFGKRYQSMFLNNDINLGFGVRYKSRYWYIL
jgi:hypothetical protein